RIRQRIVDADCRRSSSRRKGRHRPRQGENRMLYMVMHKMTAELEQGLPPERRIIEEMGKLVTESQRSGIFQDGAGLKRSAGRLGLVSSNGRTVQVDGPLKGENELINRFLILRVPTMDDAITWSERIAGVLGDVEIDVGPVVEPWDLGFIPKPAHPPL